MPLKNMFENKKLNLNLNQPILSVRKHSPMEVNRRKTENGQPIKPSRLDPSSPVKIAGAVPFHWEKTPGQPKQTSDNFIQTRDYDEAFVDAVKKQSPVRQQERRLKEEIVQRNNEENQESDDRNGYLLPSCGLRPGFCLTSSVCLVNPVPAKQARLIGCGSNRKTFQELLSDQSGSKGGSVVYKTVHVDSLRELDTVRPFSTNAQENGFPGSIKNIEEDEKEMATKKVLKQLPRLITLGNSGKNYSEFLVPPPLLKSPSDSWLWHTLLSASTKNVSRHYSKKVVKTIVPGRM